MTNATIEVAERSGRDLRFEDQAHAELQALHYVELRQVRCHVDGRRLELRGCVSSFFLKQVAQSTLLRRFENALEISNRLAVIPKPSGRRPDDP